MSWFYLILAIGLEVSGTTCMKLSDGFARTTASLLVFVFYGLSIAALTLAMKHIDISISYAVWSGLGTGLITLIGVVWFGEAMTLLKTGALALIILGVMTLHLSQ